jgi:hypothetical protein
MGTPVKRNLAKYSGSRSHCDGAIADGSGNVAHATIGGLGLSVWQVYATDGSDRGTFFSEPYEVQGATVGFLGLTGSYLTLWSPDGVKLAQNTVVSDFDASWLLPATTGGIVVVVTDSWGCPKGVDGISTMKVYRFADSGGLVSGVDIGGHGCPVGGSPELSGASDDKGNTVVAVSLGYRGAYGMPPGHVIVRWVSAAGEALTDWVDAGETLVGASGPLQTFPIIGGGAIVQAGNRSVAFASGSATPQSALGFVAANRKLVIVRGGRAYASVAIPGDYGAENYDSIELYAPSGRKCGEVKFPGTTALFIGRDGTVISLGPADWCAASWWPHLLRSATHIRGAISRGAPAPPWTSPRRDRASPWNLCALLTDGAYRRSSEWRSGETVPGSIHSL